MPPLAIKDGPIPTRRQICSLVWPLARTRSPSSPAARQIVSTLRQKYSTVTAAQITPRALLLFPSLRLSCWSAQRSWPDYSTFAADARKNQTTLAVQKAPLLRGFFVG